MRPTADFLHSLTPCPPVSSYPLYFDTLVHTFIRVKSQPVSPQSLPNTCRLNTRSGIPFVHRDPLSLVLFTPNRRKLAGLTPSFSSAAFHSFPLFVTLKPVSPLLATHTKSTPGYTPLPFKILAIHASAASSDSYFSVCTIRRNRSHDSNTTRRNAASCRGTIYRALCVPNESIKRSDRNDFPVDPPSQLEWN
jgi:hypothetical protein